MGGGGREGGGSEQQFYTSKVDSVGPLCRVSKMAVHAEVVQVEVHSDSIQYSVRVSVCSKSTSVISSSSQSVELNYSLPTSS